jgi:hypothetical protein
VVAPLIAGGVGFLRGTTVDDRDGIAPIIGGLEGLLVGMVAGALVDDVFNSSHRVVDAPVTPTFSASPGSVSIGLAGRF